MDPKLVITELIKYKPQTKNDIEIFKHKLCKKYKLNVIYNSELLSFYQILVKNQTIKPNQHLELLVQNLDGTIGWRNSYGNDPRKSRG